MTNLHWSCLIFSSVGERDEDESIIESVLCIGFRSRQTGIAPTKWDSAHTAGFLTQSRLKITDQRPVSASADLVLVVRVSGFGGQGAET
jgi:hypothetical protein